MSRVARPLASVATALLASAGIAACGSGSHTGFDPRGAAGSNPSQTEAAQEGLSFARCMRSHGVPNFPDPSASGGINFNSVPGINASSPAFRTALTACRKPAAGEAGTVDPADSASVRAARALGGVHARPRHRRTSGPEARPAARAQLTGNGPLRDTDGRRRLLGRDPDLGQRALAGVHARVDCVRRIAGRSSGIKGRRAETEGCGVRASALADVARRHPSDLERGGPGRHNRVLGSELAQRGLVVGLDDGKAV